mgnify:FL=1
MNICFLTSECVPFAKTGGLADVSGALPVALEQEGHHVKLFMPLYDSIAVLDHGFVHSSDISPLSISMGHNTISVHVWYGHLPGSDVEVYLIDFPHYFHRGTLYTNDSDEADRFILLQHAAFHVMQRYSFSPDIIHANDWQGGLMPAMLKYAYGWDDLFKSTRTLLTIHNLAYQGLTDPGKAFLASLPMEEAQVGGEFEYNGALSPLKTGLLMADRVNAVSPTYAAEIQTSAFGEGLDHLLRSRAACVSGILNGIDTTIWDPATDRHLPHPFHVDDVSGKRKNRDALCAELNLSPSDSAPLIGIVSRLASQKGFNLLMPIMDDILKQTDACFAVLGSGQPDIEAFFRETSARHPGRIGLKIGFNEGLAHRIEAGSDLFLMPSLYEPCGLNQMYSLRYGTVPVVHRTGGLADTVIDADENPALGNGFSFGDAHPNALSDAIRRAIQWHKSRPDWKRIQENGMRTDFSWKSSAKRYIELYESALSGPC